MTDVTFEEIMRAVKKLTPEQKRALKETLEMPDMSPTREALLAEFAARRAAGAFDPVESLRNKYANSAFDDLTDEQLSKTIHDAATEWEQELDEFFKDDS
jgi:hypothetical protein